MAMHEDRGLHRRAGLTGPGGRLLFLLSLWASLATAIVCAIVPAGLPLTRTTGSAFDPSTTIVALRSRPPAPIRATLPRIGEGDGAGLGDGPAAVQVSTPVAVVAVIVAPLGTTVFHEVLDLLLRAIPVALYARPPPAA